MNPQKIYQALLDSLADPVIGSRIAENISDKLSGSVLDGQTELFPRDDTAALAAENADLTRRIAMLELENSKLRGDCVSLSAQLGRAREALSGYESRFGSQISLHDKFGRLSPDTAKTVKGFFKNSSVTGLFLCGVQPENLKSMRSFTERLAVDGFDKNADDIRILDELYIYLVDCINSTLSAPVYELTKFKEGDEYDQRLCYNIGTARSGRISRVLLQGCVCSGGAKVIRKAIVEL